MRYLSQVFQPIISIPKNAKIKNTEITCKSQKLLLECGLIRPTSSGLFTILPLARRALNKLEALIRACIEECGGQQISLPALTSTSLWEASGRLQGAPAELLKLDDRHGKKYLLAPTHEESIADLLADVGPLSYKQLPLLLYQISNKYRDEHRPKHGLLRAREFSMMDLYGIHGNLECAEKTYDNVTRGYRKLFEVLKLPAHKAREFSMMDLYGIHGNLECAEKTYDNVIRGYRKLFEVLKLPAYKVEAPSGEMGGTLSHEWQICAGAGEDLLSVCLSCSHATLKERDRCQCGGIVEKRSSIEVGHTFILGTKYSEALNANFISSEGKPQPLIMSCYGIGITRLLSASLEAKSTDKALRWPEAIAPYKTIVIGPKEGSKEWSAGFDKVEAVCSTISKDCSDVLVDDRHGLTIGKRMLMADRMGYPNIIVCGKSTLESPPRYEVYKTSIENTPKLCTLEEIPSFVDDTTVFDRVVNKG